MHRFFFSLVFIVVLVPMIVFADPVETLHNGGFEEGLNGDRPAYWYIGFLEEPLPPGTLTWALDDSVFEEGETSLRMETTHPDGAFVSQIADGNTNIFTGTEVFVSFDARVSADAAATLFVLAVNPELPPDPAWDVGLAGQLTLSQGDTSGGWVNLSGSFTATEQASYVVVMPLVSGDGPVWFDDISITWEQPPVGAMPDPPDVEPAFDERDFGWGFVNENPRNLSEYAELDVPAEIDALGGDTATLFFHVRYNQLTGKPLLDGFERGLRLSEYARAYGLDRVLVFDFTHDSVEGLGNLNPLPDGTSPGSFTDAAVRDAMQAELLAIAEQVEPMAVMVGIEINFFYEQHPEWWETFVDWYHQVREQIKETHPDCLVSVYVTLDFYVDNEGEPKWENLAAFADLLPGLDVIAYSIYFFSDDLANGLITPGMFGKMHDIVPDKPIALPEFGIATNTNPAKDDEQLHQVELLQMILDEVAGFGSGCAFATLYSLYDFFYCGAEPWFQEAFGQIGVYDFSYSPKLAAAWFAQIAAMKPGPVDDDVVDDDTTIDDDTADDDDDNDAADDDDDNDDGCGC